MTSPSERTVERFVYMVEAGRSGSIEAAVRLAGAFGWRTQLELTDPRRRERPRAELSDDPVHSAMGELEAAHLRRLGFPVGIDEPYQHYHSPVGLTWSPGISSATPSSTSRIAHASRTSKTWPERSTRSVPISAPRSGSASACDAGGARHTSSRHCGRRRFCIRYGFVPNRSARSALTRRGVSRAGGKASRHLRARVRS